MVAITSCAFLRVLTSQRMVVMAGNRVMYHRDSPSITPQGMDHDRNNNQAAPNRRAESRRGAIITSTSHRPLPGSTCSRTYPLLEWTDTYFEDMVCMTWLTCLIEEASDGQPCQARFGPTPMNSVWRPQAHRRFVKAWNTASPMSTQTYHPARRRTHNDIMIAK